MLLIFFWCLMLEFRDYAATYSLYLFITFLYMNLLSTQTFFLFLHRPKVWAMQSIQKRNLNSLKKLPALQVSFLTQCTVEKLLLDCWKIWLNIRISGKGEGSYLYIQEGCLVCLTRQTSWHHWLENGGKWSSISLYLGQMVLEKCFEQESEDCEGLSKCSLRSWCMHLSVFLFFWRGPFDYYCALYCALEGCLSFVSKHVTTLAHLVGAASIVLDCSYIW